MKGSRRRDNQENAYLIEKYGLESVQTLIEYLEDEYSYSAEVVDLKKAHKLQDQINYLKNQRMRHFNHRKQTIIEHIMDCLDDEKAKVLCEFQEERKSNLAQIIEEARQIQLQLQNQHTYEMKKLESQTDQHYESFMNKKSQKIIDLTYQLEQLCMREQYQQAELARQALQQQRYRFSIKKNSQWKDHRKKQLKILEFKQQKQRNSLRTRLQAMVNEQIKSKNIEFEKLVKKIGIQQEKIYKYLSKQHKYKPQISSLVTSRLLTKSNDSRSFSRNGCSASKQLRKGEAETGPSSQAQTDRLNYETNCNNWNAK